MQMVRLVYVGSISVTDYKYRHSDLSGGTGTYVDVDRVKLAANVQYIRKLKKSQKGANNDIQANQIADARHLGASLS